MCLGDFHGSEVPSDINWIEYAEYLPVLGTYTTQIRTLVQYLVLVLGNQSGINERDGTSEMHSVQLQTSLEP